MIAIEFLWSTYLLWLCRVTFIYKINRFKTFTLNCRRFPEVDKKLTSKAPKKARQEDDEETSDGDAEAISARKKEIESVTSAAADSSPKPVDLESDSDSDADTKRNKPGPKRKKAGNLV